LGRHEGVGEGVCPAGVFTDRLEGHHLVRYPERLTFLGSDVQRVAAFWAGFGHRGLSSLAIHCPTHPCYRAVMNLR
jgi:hypothetical protein